MYSYSFKSCWIEDDFRSSPYDQAQEPGLSRCYALSQVPHAPRSAPHSPVPSRGETLPPTAAVGLKERINMGLKKGGFHKWGYPPIIHFRFGLSILNHPAVGSTQFYGDPQMGDGWGGAPNLLQIWPSNLGTASIQLRETPGIRAILPGFEGSPIWRRSHITAAFHSHFWSIPKIDAIDYKLYSLWRFMLCYIF